MEYDNGRVVRLYRRMFAYFVAVVLAIINISAFGIGEEADGNTGYNTLVLRFCFYHVCLVLPSLFFSFVLCREREG